MTSPTLNVIYSSFIHFFIHSLNKCQLCPKYSANPRAWGGGHTEMAAGMRVCGGGVGHKDSEGLTLSRCHLQNAVVLTWHPEADSWPPSLPVDCQSPVHLPALPQFPSQAPACVGDSVSVLYPRRLTQVLWPCSSAPSLGWGLQGQPQHSALEKALGPPWQVLSSQ